MEFDQYKLTYIENCLLQISRLPENGSYDGLFEFVLHLFLLQRNAVQQHLRQFAQSSALKKVRTLLVKYLKLEPLTEYSNPHIRIIFLL